MKRSLLFLLMLFSVLSAFAEMLNPVKWQFGQKKISDTEVELRFTATIEPSWHIYGMEIPENGPRPTSFEFEKIEGAKLKGSAYITPESKQITHYDEQFAMELSWYENRAVFVQRISLNEANGSFRINGTVRYMSCNDESCIADKEDFLFVSKEKKITAKDSGSAAVTALPPVADSLNTTNSIAEAKHRTPISEKLKAFGNTADEHDNSSLWLVFLGGLLGGFLALFTPCVWPIIPMTVSFFLKRNKDRRKGRNEAILYGLSIIVIYVLLGLLVTVAFGASSLNELSTNAIFNVLFFVLLLVFAASFFGYFDMTLPATWSSALNNRAEHASGFLSILLMATTLVIVSFSCTGPIIGTLLVEAATAGSLLAPAVGMFGFALALSLPFSLFALFPAWLNDMPRSGSWLNTVKVSLAFFETGLALKFLSVADMTQSWGILPRPLFIALWIALAVAWALYMLGFIRFPHDKKEDRISWLRKSFALPALAFALYLTTGFFGAPLKMVSAFLPPMQNTAHFTDFESGMTYARENNKPVFLDFTGYGCVNCRKMEAAVFSNPDVERLLAEYAVINLYVDDRTALDSAYTVIENGKEQRISTVGDKYSYLQRSSFGANAQPYYVLLGNDGTLLLKSYYAYDEDIAHFCAFLKQGLKNYSEIKN